MVDLPHDSEFFITITSVQVPGEMFLRKTGIILLISLNQLWEPYPTALAILIAKLSCLLIYSFKSRFFIFLSSKGKTLSLKFSQMRSPLFFTYQNSRRRCGASLVHSPTTHTVTPVPVWYILR